MHFGIQAAKVSPAPRENNRVDSSPTLRTKSSILESMVEGFRQTSRSSSTDRAGMPSSTDHTTSKRPRDSDSGVDLESDKNLQTQKWQPKGSESVDLSVDAQVDSLFTKNSSKAQKNQKTQETFKSNFLGSTAAKYNLDEACSADVDVEPAKVVNKKLKERLTNSKNVAGTKVKPKSGLKLDQLRGVET